MNALFNFLASISALCTTAFCIIAIAARDPAQPRTRLDLTALAFASLTLIFGLCGLVTHPVHQEDAEVKKHKKKGGG